MKVTIYVEKAGDKYKVVRVKNALGPSVGEILDANRVQSLINAGKEVIVDLPRNRE